MERIDCLRYEHPRCSFHGGTFTANPISMTAGRATLMILEDGRLLSRLNKTGERIRNDLEKIFQQNDVGVQVTGLGSLFNTHFTREEVKNARVASRADKHKQMDYHLNLLANGVFLLPTHTGALSTAHSEIDIKQLLGQTEEYARQTQLS